MFQAAQFKTKQIDEDGLLELVKTRPGKKSKYTIKAEEEAKKVSVLNIIRQVQDGGGTSLCIYRMSACSPVLNGLT